MLSSREFAVKVKDDISLPAASYNIIFVLPVPLAAGFALNPSYNGSNDSTLLVAGQNLANQTSNNTDYFFKLRVSFRVSNLNSSIYENSAVGTASIGSLGTSSYINVADSSNNGSESAVDPNNNGNAGEPGENNPTPFNFSILPVRFISINASFVDNTSAMVNWEVATPTVNSDKFQVEYSTDGKSWMDIGTIPIINANQSKYELSHADIPPGNLYYRIKEIDIDGAYTYSNIALLRSKNNSGNFIIYPNPANNVLTINRPANGTGNTKIMLYDAAGKLISSLTLTANSLELNTALLPDGIYILKIENGGTVSNQKVMIMHK